jgi:hypothetical protein
MTMEDPETPAEPFADLDNDWFLDLIVNLAEAGIGADITLTIGGASISGVIVGNKYYFDEQAKAVERATFDGDAPKEYAEAVKSVMSSGAKAYENFDISSLDLTATPRFIHLRNARWVGGLMHPDDAGMLWRGRLSAVQGFSLGRR